MNIENWIALLGIIVTLVTTIVTISSEIHFFQSYPDYEIKLITIDSKNHQYSASIQNIGSVQAKKVSVYTIASGNVKMKNQTCFEITSNSTMNNTTIKLDFERMSSGMLCEVSLISDNKLDGFIVLSDDMPARAYFPTKDSFNTDTVVYKDVKQVTQPIYNWGMLAITLELVVIFVILIIAQQIRKRKLQILDFDASEIISSADKYSKEFSTLYEKLLLDEKLPQNLRTRMDLLQTKILEQKRKLDEITTKKKMRKQRYIEIEEYFRAWEKFEKRAIDLINQEKIIMDVDITINQVIGKINERRKIEDECLESLKSLIEYRNKLTLGSAKITKKEMNNNIQSINQLSEKLFYQKRTAV